MPCDELGNSIMSDRGGDVVALTIYVADCAGPRKLRCRFDTFDNDALSEALSELNERFNDDL